MSASLAETVARLGRGAPWEVRDRVRVRGDVGHPQGLSRWGAGWLVTTVFPRDRRGEVLAVDPGGRIEHRWVVGDGERFHPGGFAFDDARRGWWLAVAEYRPASTTDLCFFDGDDTATVARLDDHLGLVVPLPDGDLLAGTWGSRDLWVLSPDGARRRWARNPGHLLDHQDGQPGGGDLVVLSGVGTFDTPQGIVGLGGLAIWSAAELRCHHEVPVAAWFDSGRPATYNGVHLDVVDGELVLVAIADDRDAEVVTFGLRR